MTYVRVARDQRGYETTMLLHSPRPGDRPRVLYWYRTAPGVRVGRAPLDEAAIRTIEEQHPDIEFDWPQLFEEASQMPPLDVDRRAERPRRRASRPRETAPAESARAVRHEPGPRLEPDAPALAEAEDDAEERAPAILLEPELLGLDALDAEAPESDATGPRPRARPAANPLLDQLVGREIATRLRSRYDEVSARIESLDESSARSAWQARADVLDPDRWSSPEAILHGIQHADRLFDELKRELP